MPSSRLPTGRGRADAARDPSHTKAISARLASPCRAMPKLFEDYHIRFALAALVHAFGGLLDHFGRHVATEIDLDHDIVGIEVVVALHRCFAPLRRRPGGGAICEHREPSII